MAAYPFDAPLVGALALGAEVAVRTSPPWDPFARTTTLREKEKQI